MSQVQRQVTRQTAHQKKLDLALGGGGVRGLAHVGVIRALEREGIAIDCIFLLHHAGDDPASADLYLAIPLAGFSSLVRTSAGRRFIALGEEMAQVALPDIKAALR